MTRAYDPAATFELKVSEVEFRRATSGRTLLARIYQPQGVGPFPALVDLHGGAWNNKDRSANEPMDRAVAASGVLVVAIDMTLAPEAPYPASVHDANFGVRWLKSNAGEWNGDAANLGVLGSSSGGHIAQLLALRPRDVRYNTISLPMAPNVDATVAYVATRSPISDAAGGECELHVFEGCEHEWVAKPGPQTDRAHEMVKGFIARNVRVAR